MSQNNTKKRGAKNALGINRIANTIKRVCQREEARRRLKRMRSVSKEKKNVAATYMQNYEDQQHMFI